MQKLLIPLALLYATTLMGQSPWSLEKGKGFTQLGSSFIGPYNTLFIQNTHDDFVTSRELSDFTLQLYSEFGLGNGWEASLVLPFVIQSAGELSENPSLTLSTAEGNLSALGNTHLGIKREVYKGNFIFSTALRIELPTGSFDENTGLRTGYDAIALAPSMILGKGGEKWYAYLSTGPTFRLNEYSNEWRFEVEAGYQLHPKFYAMMNVFLIESFRDGEVVIAQANLETGFYVNNQSFFAFGPKLLWSITEKFGVSAAAYGAFGGNNVAKSPSLNAGIFLKW